MKTKINRNGYMGHENTRMCDPQCRHIRRHLEDDAVKTHAGLCVGTNGGRIGYGTPGLAKKTSVESGRQAWPA
jgi:hypothetical protein